MRKRKIGKLNDMCSERCLAIYSCFICANFDAFLVSLVSGIVHLLSHIKSICDVKTHFEYLLIYLFVLMCVFRSTAKAGKEN
jgi:hypothetical protein